MKILFYIIGYISSIMLIFGLSSKILGYHFGNQLFIIGIIIFSLFFMPYYFIKGIKQKTILQKTKFVMGLSASLIIGLSSIFKVFHLQGSFLLLIIGTIVLGIGFLPLHFYSLYKETNDT